MFGINCFISSADVEVIGTKDLLQQLERRVVEFNIFLEESEFFAVSMFRVMGGNKDGKCHLKKIIKLKSTDENFKCQIQYKYLNGVIDFVVYILFRIR